jgi:1-deoxy-D-xylulose-5-phosphate reductoisomerase
MGAKITIDSATLMNKVLEEIEAKWLFNLQASQIDEIVHPQSIVHSLVQFEDGSIKAQMGLPDMKLPIQYALAYPQRLKNNFPRFNFLDYPSLTFEKADMETFPSLRLAYTALERAGNMPCVLNAANEVAVEAFLADSIGFCDMSDIVETTLEKMHYIKSPDYVQYIDSDREAREVARMLLKSK